MGPSPDGADVVVVGAGIIGCAVAYRLAESGRRVVVVDAGPNAGSGTTSASSAIVRFHYGLRDNAAMAWDSYHAWTDWPAEIGGVDPDGMIEYRTTGGLLLGQNHEFETMIGNFVALGIDHAVLDPGQIRSRFPAIDPSGFGPPCRLDDPGFEREPSGALHGLFTPAAGYVTDPQLAARNYQWAGERNGASFLFRERVVGIGTRDGQVVGVDLGGGGSISSPVVVNAAGPASDQLIAVAGIADSHLVRSRPLLTETHVAPAPPQYVGSEAPFVFDPDLGSAFRPEIGDLVHVSNIEPECDELHWATDPWEHRDLPTHQNYQTQVLRVARRMPETPIPPTPRGLSSLYDVTPDWNPLLDATDLGGFFLACGTSGNSFKTAPTIGHIVTRLVVHSEDSSAEPTPDHLRFVTPHTGHRIDLDRYSRNRVTAPSINVIA